MRIVYGRKDGLQKGLCWPSYTVSAVDALLANVNQFHNLSLANQHRRDILKILVGQTKPYGPLTISQLLDQPFRIWMVWNLRTGKYHLTLSPKRISSDTESKYSDTWSLNILSLAAFHPSIELRNCWLLPRLTDIKYTASDAVEGSPASPRALKDLSKSEDNYPIDARHAGYWLVVDDDTSHPKLHLNCCAVEPPEVSKKGGRDYGSSLDVWKVVNRIIVGGFRYDIGGLLQSCNSNLPRVEPTNLVDNWKDENFLLSCCQWSIRNMNWQLRYFESTLSSANLFLLNWLIWIADSSWIVITAKHSSSLRESRRSSMIRNPTQVDFMFLFHLRFALWLFERWRRFLDLVSISNRCPH